MIVYKFKKILLYFFVSGGAAIINFLSRLLYNEYFCYTISVICAYFTGMIFNFMLSSFFVFKLYNNASIKHVFFKFFLIALLGLIVTAIVANSVKTALLICGCISIQLSELIGHIFGISVAFIVSFIGHRIFTYRATGISDSLRRLRA